MKIIINFEFYIFFIGFKPEAFASVRDGTRNKQEPRIPKKMKRTLS